MDTNVYALETMARERLAHLRDEARRMDLLALARVARPALRVRLGVALVALGEWLRREPVLVPAAQP
jgi:hypothetical protein